MDCIAGNRVTTAIEHTIPGINLREVAGIDDIRGNIDLARLRIHPVGIIAGIDGIGESIPGFRVGDDQSSGRHESLLAPIHDHAGRNTGVFPYFNDHLTVVAVGERDVESVRIFAGRHTEIQLRKLLTAS